MRILDNARQKAWLAGNVLNELHQEAHGPLAASSTLLPYACVLAPPFVPFSTASLLSGQPKKYPPVHHARKRNLVCLRLWFRVGQEVKREKFGQVIRQLSLAGRIAVTKYKIGKKLCFSITLERTRRPSLEAALKSFLPGLELVEHPSPHQRIGPLLKRGYRLEVQQFCSSMPYWRAFPTAKDLDAPLLQAELGALRRIHPGLAFVEAVFERAQEGWVSNWAGAQAGETRALQVGHVGQWGFEGIEANKTVIPNAPPYAVVLRCGVCVPPAMASEAIGVISQPYRGLYHGTRPLEVLDTAQHLAAVGPPERVAKMLEDAEVHSSGLLMNEEELASFVHTPAAEVLEGAQCRLDRTIAPPVPLNLRSGGTQIGWQVYANKLLPVVVPDWLRSCMLSLEGTTGSGKTEGLINLIVGDLERGVISGGLVVDFHGLLCPRILRLLPREWIEKTVYLKPDMAGHVFRYNPYAGEVGDVATRTDHTVDGIRMLYKDSEWGSNVEEDSRRYNYLLHTGDGLCLADAPVFTAHSAAGQRLLQEILPHVENEEILRSWEDYRKSRGSNMKKALNKVLPFLSSPAGRMFSQPDNALDLRKCMREGKLILADLAIGSLGAMAADAIASFLLSQVFSVRMERLVDEQNLEFWADYVDESHRITASVLRSLATQQRKTNTPMTVAFQSRDLFGAKAKTALRNIASSICLKQHPEDAAQAARLGAGLLDPRQMIGSSVGTGWAFIDSHVVPVRLLPPRKPKARNYARDIVDHSLANYYLTDAQFKEKVEERRARHGVKAKRRRGYDEI